MLPCESYVGSNTEETQYDDEMRPGAAAQLGMFPVARSEGGCLRREPLIHSRYDIQAWTARTKFRRTLTLKPELRVGSSAGIRFNGILCGSLDRWIAAIFDGCEGRCNLWVIFGRLGDGSYDGVSLVDGITAAPRGGRWQRCRQFLFFVWKFCSRRKL